MTAYDIAKFAHIAFAALWLGGGATMVLLGWLLGAPDRQDGFMAVVRQVALLGTRLFTPCSIATLLTGLVMVWQGGTGWPAWIVLGCGGIAFGALYGGLVLGPLADRAAAAADPCAGYAMGRRLLRLAAFEYAVQFSIVWVMVTKPGWADLPLLAPPAVAITVAAALVLRAAAAPRAA